MDEDDKVLVRRLMAKVIALLEGAVETAASGQSDRLAAPSYARAAGRLQAAVRDIAVLAEAAAIIANPSVNQGSNRPKHPR